MSTFEVEDRELELEEPFAGPANLEDQDITGEDAAAPSAASIDPDIETNADAAATAQGQPTPVVQPSATNTHTTDSTDQGPPAPVEEVSTSMNSLNPVDQDQPIPTEEEQEEFVPPERLIAQASSTPHSLPIPTNNLFDPLGDDDESTVEDTDNESIARRIQEQYDLEAAFEASAAEAGVEPEPANVEVGGAQLEEGVGEAAASASSAGQVERDRTRRRGCRAGAKHLPGRENLAYGTTCEYIRAQLGDSTYARFGRRFNLPLISPHVARKQYPEWFAYVLRHSDRWAFDTEGELLPVDTILRWATILPELWQFLYSINPTLLQGTPQPQYRLPKRFDAFDQPRQGLHHLVLCSTQIRRQRRPQHRLASTVLVRPHLRSPLHQQQRPVLRRPGQPGALR